MADEIFGGEHARALRELWTRIRDVRIAMLTTVGTDGSLHARPMVNQRVEPEDVLWFFSAKDTLKVDELTENQRVQLAWSAPDRDLYVSATGLAQVVNDRERARALWNDDVAAWFPDGPDDPNLCLLRVDLFEARWWQEREPGSVSLAERLTGGGEPAPARTEHGNLRL